MTIDFSIHHHAYSQVPGLAERIEHLHSEGRSKREAIQLVEEAANGREFLKAGLVSWVNDLWNGSEV